MLVFLDTDRIGAGGDVGKNGTFNSTPAWLLLPAPFEAGLVLQQEFVSQNVLSSPVVMCWINFSMASLEDQSSPPSPVIMMPIGRLGRA